MRTQMRDTDRRWEYAMALRARHLTVQFGYAAVAVLLLLSCSQKTRAQDFYAGKQVTLLVGAGTGGGYDLQARIAARHLGKHIPGHPSIVVQNIPSRITAANVMYSTAMKDGTTIALLQRTILLAKMISPSGVRFEIGKFHWLGSLNTETAVTLAWNTAPHRTASDLFDKELTVGGIAGADPETTPRLYNALIGTRFKVVTGYSSTAQVAAAVERGEVQGIGDWSWSSLKAVRPQWLAEKKVTLLMQGALKNEPELGSLPNALEFIRNEVDRKVMELHFTQKTAARPLVAPPGVPADRVALLRKAFESLARDKEFLAEMEAARMEFNFVSGPEIDRIVAKVLATPADIAGRYAKAFGPEQK
jgi:tripartite-type tricarboxylate transporter receptor subunit TctC